LTVVNSITNSGFGNGTVAPSNASLTSGVAGKFGNAFRFNRGGGAVRPRINTSYKLSATGDWTLAGWYKSNGATGTGYIACSYHSAGDYVLFYGPDSENSDHKARLAVKGVPSIYSTVAPAIGQWHFYVATRQDDTFSLYMDGVLQGSETVAGVSVQQTYALNIGGLNSASTPNTKAGDLDEVWVFDHALRVDEINLLYKNNAVGAYDPSPADGDLVDPALTTLSWTMPKASNPACDPNSTICNVFISEDPSMAGATQLVNNAFAESATVSLTAGVTYYWCVDVTDPNCSSAVEDDLYYPGDVWSFTTVPLQAYNPAPANEATGVGIWPDFSWTPGLTSAVSHKLYLSEDEDAVTNRTVTPIETTETFTTTDALEFATTYYWAVDGIDGASATVLGDVWSFTTANTFVFEPMGYDTSANLQAVWTTGDPNYPALCTTTNRMRMPYYDVSNTYTQLLGDDDTGLDFSTASQLQYVLYLEGLSGVAIENFPQWTIQLLDASDTVLYAFDSSNYDAETLLASTIDYQLMRHDVSAASSTLAAVRKIQFIVDGYPSISSAYGIVVDDIAIAGITCDDPSIFDADGNCIIDLKDLTALAAEWLTCGLFPASACP